MHTPKLYCYEEYKKQHYVINIDKYLYLLLFTILLVDDELFSPTAELVRLLILILLLFLCLFLLSCSCSSRFKRTSDSINTFSSFRNIDSAVSNCFLVSFSVTPSAINPGSKLSLMHDAIHPVFFTPLVLICFPAHQSHLVPWWMRLSFITFFIY
jgi:hypothetical protein